MTVAPFFTVIIPTFNRANKISEAVSSVISQTFIDFELIIVDDGSTDSTADIIAGFGDKRITYIFQENKERSAARNNGIKNAKADFICFLDSDDTYLPDHLETLHKYIVLSQKKIAVFSTGMLRVDEENIAVGHPMIFRDRIHPVLFVWKYFLFANTVCAHKEVFREHLFDERFRIWEDTHLWLRLLSSFPFYQIPRYTVVQKQHKESTVQVMFKNIKVSEMEQYILAVDDVFDNHFELIKPFLTLGDRDAYIEKKYRMFYQKAIHNKQYDIANYISKARNKRLKNDLKFVYRMMRTMISRYTRK